jgi:hypothetical protein
LNGSPLGDFAPEHTLCPAAGRMYFGRLDAGLSKLLGPSAPARAAYLWVSFIIELRAGWVYPFYEKMLAEKKISLPIKSVIAEEEKHLEEMQSDLTQLGMMNDILFARAAALETKLFTRLLGALSAEVGSVESACRAAHA